MPAIRHSVVRWKELPEAERVRLGEEVAGLLVQVFEGLGPDDVARFIANFEVVQLSRRDGGALVGFNSLRFVEVHPAGAPRPVWVMNHFAGLLPEYRGGNTVLGLMLRESFRHWFSHGRETFYYCCRFIHPSPYRLFVKFGSQPYPSPQSPSRPELDELVGALGRELGYPLERNASGHWVTRPAFRVATEKQGTEAYLRSDPITQYFVEQCPRYRDGQGLMVIMPLGYRAAFEGPLRIGLGALTRAWRRPRRSAEPSLAS